MLRSRRTHALAVLALLATPLFLFGDRALAIQDPEDKVWFGPVGITPGERALVNVYATFQNRPFGARSESRSGCVNFRVNPDVDAGYNQTRELRNQTRRNQSWP